MKSAVDYQRIEQEQLQGRESLDMHSERWVEFLEWKMGREEHSTQDSGANNGKSRTFSRNRKCRL